VVLVLDAVVVLVRVQDVVIVEEADKLLKFEMIDDVEELETV
jgi:hypothetical protein